MIYQFCHNSGFNLFFTVLSILTPFFSDLYPFFGFVLITFLLDYVFCLILLTVFFVAIFDVFDSKI